jgi:hypothetical protein
LQSQRLTLQRLACDADMVLDLHCDFEAVEHLYTTPEAWPQVEPLARYLGVQASLLATDSGGQSFDECFSLVWWQLQQRFGKRFPIPMGSFSVTIELRGQADVSHALATQDCQAILDFLTHSGVIDGQPAPLPALRQPATPLAAVEPVTAPLGGLLVFHAKPGSTWKRGNSSPRSSTRSATASRRCATPRQGCCMRAAYGAWPRPAWSSPMSLASRYAAAATCWATDPLPARRRGPRLRPRGWRWFVGQGRLARLHRRMLAGLRRLRVSGSGWWARRRPAWCVGGCASSDQASNPT